MELLEVSVRVILGVGVALGGGHFFVGWVHRWLKRCYQPDDPGANRKRVPAWLTGFFERSLFTVIVGLDPMFAG
jgi:hypothetical protein